MERERKKGMSKAITTERKRKKKRVWMAFKERNATSGVKDHEAIATRMHDC